MNETGIWSVSELNEYVSGLLAADPFLPNLRVQGEISGYKRHSSGHLYFTLKDAGALVRCVMFRTQAMALPFQPGDGMQVLLTGSAGLYQRDGTFQLYVKNMERVGQGALHQRYLALKSELEAAGLFDPAHKKPIPFLPKCIGVVTSGTGAALQDILNIITRRFPNMNICVCPVKVQGAGAAEEIALGIAKMNALSEADVLIVGRGGGSIEDLWAFNERAVAEAIYNSRIPVISAVGHETDFTIADFVADLRAPTPSAAAELAAPEFDTWLETVQSLDKRLKNALKNDLSRRWDWLRLRANSAAMALPERRVAEALLHLDAAWERINALCTERLKAEKHKLARLSDGLNALSPEGTLQRGFAFLTGPAGNTISSVSAVARGDKITAHLSDGQFHAEVVSVPAGRKKSGKKPGSPGMKQ